MSWLVGTQAQVESWRAQMDADAGCPIASGPTVGPGGEWQHLLPANQRDANGRHKFGTTHVCEDPVIASAGAAALLVPDDIADQYLGRGSLPAKAARQDTSAIVNVALKTACYAREGRDASGQPLPFREAPVGAALGTLR